MKFKLITLFIILCLGFTSCSENETPEPRTTRTILVYMMANNSLNSFASKNIESMIEGATSKNLNGGNLIVYYAPAGSPPYNPQNEMFRLLGTKRSFSQNETFFFSHPYPALFRLISHF